MQTCDEHSNIAQDLKKKNESLERDVLRFQERQKLVQKVQQLLLLFYIYIFGYLQVEILEKKKPWLQFEEQRQIALDLKEQRTKVQEAYKEAEKAKQPLQQKIKYGL